MLDQNAIHFIEKLERYGKIISDDEFSSPAYGLKFSPCLPPKIYRFVRVKLIKLQHCIYKVVKADGEYIQYYLLCRVQDNG